MTIPKQDTHAALTRLAEQFPQTFVLENHLPHRPLNAGIDLVLRRKLDALWMAPDFDVAAIALVLAEIRGLLNMPEHEPTDADDEPADEEKTPHQHRA